MSGRTLLGMAADWRQQNAGKALAAARDKLRGVIRPDDPNFWLLHAMRVLDADDAYGTGRDLVTQGDRVGWDDIDAVIELALLAARQHHSSPGHYAGRRDCDTCQAADRVGQVQLFTPLNRRRAAAGRPKLDALRHEQA